MALSQHSLYELQQNGFTSIDQLVDASEVNRLLAILTRLHENKVGFAEGALYNAAGADGDAKSQRFPQFVDPHIFAKELLDSEYFRQATKIAQQVFGENVRFKGSISFMKPAKIGSTTPWHQDVAFTNPAFESQEISFWLALTPAAVENSCMSFIPGSHRLPVLDHRPMDGNPKNFALECTADFDPSNAVVCPLSPGDCTIHTSYTLHNAGANVSDITRIAYVLEFDTPLVPRKVPLHFPWQKQQQSTDRIIRQTKWRRRGGFFVLLWRYRERITINRIIGEMRRRLPKRKTEDGICSCQVSCQHKINLGKSLITITADDFGQSVANNDGVLAAHRAGIVNTTSMMVGEGSFYDAVDIARENPGLAIGLHVCLSDGTPVSRPEDIPLLVEANGRFASNERLLHAAALSKEGRAQIRKEIEAQFRRFFASGLHCHHVDVHRHTARHPVVMIEVCRAAAARNVRRMRIPYDPTLGRQPRLTDPLRYARVVVLRRIAAYYGITWIDRVIGRNWTNPAVLADLIKQLPPGETELYFHPVVCTNDHMFKADLPVLLDNRVRAALEL
ncbi:unnamed protein product [Sphagnum tenellum]